MENQKKYCQNCGKELQDDIKFCPNCGREISAETICIKCGATVSKESKFCTECGSPMEYSKKRILPKIENFSSIQQIFTKNSQNENSNQNTEKGINSKLKAVGTNTIANRCIVAGLLLFLLVFWLVPTITINSDGLISLFFNDDAVTIFNPTSNSVIEYCIEDEFDEGGLIFFSLLFSAYGFCGGLLPLGLAILRTIRPLITGKDEKSDFKLQKKLAIKTLVEYPIYYFITFFIFASEEDIVVLPKITGIIFIVLAVVLIWYINTMLSSKVTQENTSENAIIKSKDAIVGEWYNETYGIMQIWEDGSYEKNDGSEHGTWSVISDKLTFYDEENNAIENISYAYDITINQHYICWNESYYYKP